MYEVNGEFGRVRHVQRPMGQWEIEVPFELMSAGWHCCNDKYGFRRENGFEQGHLLLFSVSAGGRFQLGDGETIELPEACVVWIPPHCRHAYYTGEGQLWELYWLHIQDAPWLCWEDIFRDQLWLSLACMDSICSKFEKMISWKNKDIQEFQIESSGVIAEIYHLLLHESYLQRAESGKGDELVQRIIRDMEAACEAEWSLPFLAEKYYISVPQLIRRFKAETGMTPHACLVNIRLQTAEKYLKYTGMTVGEISRKTGFHSVSNFIQQFSRYWGSSPQVYRKNG